MGFIFILAFPFATAAACLLSRNQKPAERLNAYGAFLTLAASVIFARDIVKNGPCVFLNGFFYADVLSAFMILIVAGLSCAGAVYSVGYMRHEAERGAAQPGSLGVFYSLLHAFVFAMMLTTVVNNMGILWVSIEATTLASVFLVGFYRKRHSIEAAWKYMIICTVGIAFALLGTFFVYYASTRAPGGPSLNWTDLLRNAGALDPGLVKLGFIFIILGYGTKAGLAPLHTWLPDAHSQAPTPVSALLSGVLLKCSMYGILRFHILSSRCMGPAFSGHLLLAFGLASIVVAAPFILLQRDFKRLLAYHSVEHIGIVATGFGFGGALGICGAMFHILNHALAKALLFFAAGDIAMKHGTKKFHHVSGIIKTMPVTAVVFLAGSLALAGMPPFSLFLSEFLIFASGISGGHVYACALFAGVLAVIFGGLLYHVLPVVFGVPRAHIQAGESNRGALILMAGLALILLATGIKIPSPLNQMITQIAAMVEGRI